jgi:hypothetical protein
MSLSRRIEDQIRSRVIALFPRQMTKQRAPPVDAEYFEYALFAVTVRRWPAPLTRALEMLLLDCLHRAAVLIEPVSADSLTKTGIFAERAGDFWRLPAQLRLSERAEKKANAQKAGISGPFSRLKLGQRLEWMAGAAGFEPRYGEFEIGYSCLSERSSRTPFH